jgi:RimJ/RimL family protein N-acetyltransferase
MGRVSEPSPAVPPSEPVPVPRLRTARLLLREWRDADRAPFAALNADPEVTATLPRALSREESDALVDAIERHWREDGYGLWALERLDDGAFLGFAGLAWASWAPDPAIEIGWRLARAAWGQGYATEAARAAAGFAFATLGLDELVSLTARANTRSRAVMERLGMSRDPASDFVHPRLAEGHPLRPHVTYRITRAAWSTAGPGARRG